MSMAQHVRSPGTVDGTTAKEVVHGITADSQANREFTAHVWREGDWYVAQALEVDIASQGETRARAIDNLSEALALHLEPPISHRDAASAPGTSRHR